MNKLFVFVGDGYSYAVYADSLDLAVLRLAETADRTRSADPADYHDDIENGNITVETPVVIA